MRRIVDTQGKMVITGLVPVGAIVAWHKTFTNTPALPSEFVECNGQTLSDTGSVYNTQTIPNLNAASSGTHRFLRGSTTSGSTSGSENHTHTGTTDPEGTSSAVCNGGGSLCVAPMGHSHSFTTDATSTLPSYFEVVWIMRVK